MMIIVDIGYRRPLHVVGSTAVSAPGSPLLSPPSVVAVPGDDNGDCDERRDSGLG